MHHAPYNRSGIVAAQEAIAKPEKHNQERTQDQAEQVWTGTGAGSKAATWCCMSSTTAKEETIEKLPYCTEPASCQDEKQNKLYAIEMQALEDDRRTSPGL